MDLGVVGIGSPRQAYSASIDVDAIKEEASSGYQKVQTSAKYLYSPSPVLTPTPAEAYKMCQEILTTRNTDTTPVIDKLKLSHDCARDLSLDFKKTIYQKEVDLLLGAVEDAEKRMETAVEYGGAERYMESLDEFKTLTAYYNDFYFHLTKDEIHFAQHDPRADFAKMVEIASAGDKYSRPSGDDWERIFYFATQESLDVDMLRQLAQTRSITHLQKLYPRGTQLSDYDSEKLVDELSGLGMDPEAVIRQLRIKLADQNTPSEEPNQESVEDWLQNARQALQNSPSSEYRVDRYFRVFENISPEMLNAITSEEESAAQFRDICDTAAQELITLFRDPSIDLHNSANQGLQRVLTFSSRQDELVQALASVMHGKTKQAIEDAQQLLAQNDPQKLPFVNDSDLWYYFFAQALPFQQAISGVLPNFSLLDDEEISALHNILLQCGTILQSQDQPATKFAEFLHHVRKLEPVMGDGISKDILSLYNTTLQQGRDAQTVQVAGSESPLNMNQVVDLARHYVQRLASYKSLGEHGMNLVYGPLCDVARQGQPAYMEQQRRIFSHDPVVSSFLARLTIGAVQRWYPRMGFVIKHAPGIGSVERNPEWSTMVVDYRDKAAIEAELSAFSKTQGQYDTVAVMVSGVAYPSLESDPHMTRPACLSPDVCHWLREQFGSDVVLFSDDLGTDAIKDYYNFSSMSAVSAEEAAKIVSDASLAGVDVCLLYSHDRDLLTKMMDQLEQTTQRGEVSREVLEASVLRILNYKKSMFPDASALVNPEERVKHMSVRELWAQKIIFPCYSVIDSKSYIQSGVGGLTFEGIQHPDYYTRMMQEYLAQNPEAIPPFMANNSPQETGARESPANPIRREETDVLAELARVLESAYPRGVPEEVVEEILSRAFDQP